MKSMLGLCFMLSLVLVFGSVNSPYSYTLSAFASDEGHTPEDSGEGDNNHGDDSQGEDSGDGDSAAQAAAGNHAAAQAAAGNHAAAQAAAGDNDDNDVDDDEGDNEPKSKGVPEPAKKIECLPGQEVPLFSTTCQPVPQPQQSSVTGCESPSQQAALEEEEPEFSPSNEGNYASQCTPSLQFGNTGNFQNNAEFLKEGGSVRSEFEPGGIEFATEPENEEGCTGTTTANGQCSNTIMPTPTPVPAP